MAEIHHTNEGAGSAMTAIVAILVIAIIAIALWFGLRGNNPAIPNTGDNTNVELNVPGDGGVDVIPGDGGATY